MSKAFLKFLITSGTWLAVFIPLFVHLRLTSWTSQEAALQSLFPFFGLLAASLLWLHALSGVWEEKLRTLFNFDQFIHWSTTLIFFSIILHPLLLLALVKFDLSYIFNTWNWPLVLGVASWLLLLTYDIIKPFRNSGFFSKHWNKILIISNIGFLLTFLHSLNLGSDLQSGFLRYLWMGYGITGAFAVLYTYAIKIRKQISFKN